MFDEQLLAPNVYGCTCHQIDNKMINTNCSYALRVIKMLNLKDNNYVTFFHEVPRSISNSVLRWQKPYVQGR